MRILNILTCISPNGDYGGPLRVAVNQARELAEKGHDVQIAAASEGFGGAPPAVFQGVACRLFPAHRLWRRPGYTTMFAPSHLRWVASRARDFDVVHLHLARDLVMLPAARTVAALGVPFIAQTHGMILPSPSPLAPMLDGAFTRPVLERAREVLVLTSEEARQVAEVAPCAPAPSVLQNGVPLPSAPNLASAGLSSEVLFLARLASRKRAPDFVRAAQLVAPHHPEATFVVVGPDEGDLTTVLDLLAEDDASGRIRYEGPVAPDSTTARMSQAGIYVLPSVEEPFGMTVVEAMAARLPVVVRSDCGLADDVRATGGEVVHGQSAADLAAAIDRLLSDPARRAAAGAAGRDHVRETRSITAVVTRLEETLLRASLR